MKTYHVEVWLENGAWIASATDADGAHTYSRTLRGLEHEVREAIAAAEDLPDEAAFDLVWDWKNSDEDIRAMARIGEQRAELDRQRRELLVEGAVRARVLVDRGIPMRDVAQLMGVTVGRVSQILGGERRAS